MNKRILLSVICAISALSAFAQAQDEDLSGERRVYVPYRDLAAVIDPNDRAVLMDRGEFAKLLAAARANKRAEDSLDLAQVTAAKYSAEVKGQRVSVTGDLTVVSMSDEPVSMPLSFGSIGLTEVRMDAKAAPLGYDSAGRLVLIVNGRGEHKITVAGTTSLSELRRGGMQFGLTVPTATAGEMTVTAAGDLEIHSVAPVTALKYDKASDRTRATLAVGGLGSVTVVLLGNGRQEDRRSIIVGDSATTVQLTASSETLKCLYTAQVFRRGARELTFLVPSAYTITDVTCPSLVRWEVRPAAAGKADQTLVVRMRTASRGTKAIIIQATASRDGSSWTSPSIRLVGADFEQGHLLVDTGDQLSIRGQSVRKAIRGGLAGANVIPGLVSAERGRLYYHWSDKWHVKLDLAAIELRTSCEAMNQVIVASEELRLLSQLDITAIGRELFEVAIELPAESEQWGLQSVTVNRSDKGFEYRVDAEGKARVLKIFLARPVPPEGVARVGLVLRKVPAGWSWHADSQPREVDVPVVHARADTVSGKVGIVAGGDLEVTGVSAPDVLKSVTVGRMAALSFGNGVQLAWTYDQPFAGEICLRASRRTERVSAASIGLVTAQPSKLLGTWRLTYVISRARAQTLYLLADKSLGRNLTISAPGRALSGKDIVAPGAKTAKLSDALAKRYDLWQLTLDNQTAGAVVVDVGYEQAISGEHAMVPLVRPIGVGQASEMFALQASDELAVTVASKGATDVDTIDLPPLPGPASRLLGAMRIESPATEAGAAAAIDLSLTVHGKYDIPAALVTEAKLTTYLGPEGSQQTEAVFQIANVGMQFLTVRLPAGAKLWSIRVDGKQARPRQSNSGNPRDYLVAIPRSIRPREVKVVFVWDPQPKVGSRAKGAAGCRLRLGPAELPGVRINRLTWSVYPPAGFEVDRQYTNMEMTYRTQPKLAALRAIALAEEVGRRVDLNIKAEANRQANEFAESDVGGVYKSRSEGNEHMPAADQPEADTSDKMSRKSAESKEELVPIPLKLPKPAFSGTPKNLPPGTRVRLAPRTGPVSSPVPPAAPEPKAELPRALMEQGKPSDEDYSAGKRGGQSSAYVKAGRYTLPVELRPGKNTGPVASFTSLGSTELEISLASRSRMKAQDYFGMAAVLLIGFALLRSRVGRKACFVAVVLAAATITAIWCPFMARVANGAFFGALILIAIYLGLWILSLLWRLALLIFGYRNAPMSATAASVLIALAGVLATSASPALAGGGSSSGKSAQSARPAPAGHAELILPYEGDPTKADANAAKVLVSYRQYVDLWNRAHPNDKIAAPAGPVRVSFAGTHYAASLDGDRMTVVLSAQVRTFGKGWAWISLPVGNLAITGATFAGKTADVQVGGRGMGVSLPGDTSGELKITAVTTAKLQGPRGSVAVSLPPLPAAVLTLELPANVELESPGAETAPTSEPQPVGKVVRWTVPVGMKRNVTLKWSPKVGAGGADRTLSAAAAHDVYAGHWATVGVSKIQYTFFAGEYERFGLLVPEGATMTALSCTNLRDFREVGTKTVDGEKMKVVEVRLHRPASKSCEITARWVTKLPAMDKPFKLALPRAAEVGRESGAVTLRAAPGMTVKVDKVVGGRRGQEASDKPTSRGMGGSEVVGRYYWPYRPFSLTLQLSRQLVTPKAHADQLIRVDRDQMQLLVQAKLSTKLGRLFGANFALPKGYELLSATGPVVEDHFTQTTPTGRILRVNFRTGVQSTSVALVLVKRDVKLDSLSVPTVAVLDTDDKVLADQTGRLAVQVAASLDAQTIGSEKLRAIVPGRLSDWLSGSQVRAVQFAYEYEQPNVSLSLKISPQKTRVRVEVFTGLTVQPTVAWYSYRLRYTVEGTPIDRVRFTLPTKYAKFADVRSPAMRSVSKIALGGEDSRTEWTVSLVNEVTGTLDVMVNFPVPIDSATTELAIPRLSTEAPEGYRAILAVQNDSRHELSVKSAERLEPLAQSEQAKLLSEAIRKNLQFVYQSFTDDWSAALSVRLAKPAARVGAIVDLLSLTTVMDRTGRCRYDVRISLQNRKHQFLRLRVPSDLTLWSANVAGQPVKPVTDPNAAKGIVLIPLVKTEPGGLPYDVNVYLAGPAGPKLGLISEIKPPAITVEGIDVVRATWSLRLPKGYRYMNPGGNLSPMAAKIGQLLAEIDAEQQREQRFVKANVSLESARAQQVANRNWYRFNRSVSGKISTARQWAEDNKHAMSKKEYTQIIDKLDDLSNTQYGVLGTWNAGQQQAQARIGNNINGFLNAKTTNAGVMEQARNSAILSLPEFVQHNATQQASSISKEMSTNESVMNKAKGSKVVAQPDQVARLADGKDLLSDADKDRGEQVEQLLNKLESEQRDNQMRRQSELKSQLSQLGGNRLERYYSNLNNHAEQTMNQQLMPQGGSGSGRGQNFYGGGSAGGPANQPVAQGTQQAARSGEQVREVADLWRQQSDKDRKAAALTGAYNGDTTIVAGTTPGSISGTYNGSLPGSNAALTNQPGAVHDRSGYSNDFSGPGQDGFIDSPQEQLGETNGREDGGWDYRSSGRGGRGRGIATTAGIAVAHGTFSLPVSLPEGGVQLDFQGPGAKPTVSVLAVDERLIGGAQNTAVVVIIFLAGVLVWKVGRQIFRRSDPTPRLLAAYVLLLVAIAALVATEGMGLLTGAILLGVIVVPVELAHRLLARRQHV